MHQVVGEDRSPDLDVKYLKEKGVPALLERLAAEIVIHKPSDPEEFLKNRFASRSLLEDGGVGSSARGGGGAGSADDAAVLHVVPLCPLSTIARMAAAVSSLKIVTKDHADHKAIGSVSPFSTAPVVEHAGLVVLEPGPAVRYIAQQTPYLPTLLRARTKVEVAFATIVANVLPEAIAAVAEKVFTPRRNNRPVDLTSVQHAASRFRSQLVQFLQGQVFIESQWVVGREPSIADMALAAGVFSVHAVAGFDAITGLAKVDKWWAQVQQQPFFLDGTKELKELAASLHGASAAALR